MERSNINPISPIVDGDLDAKSSMTSDLKYAICRYVRTEIFTHNYGSSIAELSFDWLPFKLKTYNHGLSATSVGPKYPKCTPSLAFNSYIDLQLLEL
jgi:hypothetical protein